MLKLSLGQFRTRLQAMTDTVFVYDTRNQARGITPMIETAVYDEARVFLKPDLICFKNKCGSMSLRNPRWASIDESEPAIGLVITIACADIKHPESEVRYVFLADRRSSHI